MKKLFSLAPPPAEKVYKRRSASTLFRAHGYTLLVQKSDGRGFDALYKDLDGNWLYCGGAGTSARAETVAIAWARKHLEGRERFLRGKVPSDEEE